jgi:hypothetical protein
VTGVVSPLTYFSGRRRQGHARVLVESSQYWDRLILEGRPLDEELRRLEGLLRGS